MRKFIFICSVIVFLFSGLVFAQERTQKHTASPPKNFQEAKKMGENAIVAAKEKLPTIMKEVWERQIVAFWKKAGSWVKNNILSKMERRYEEIDSGARKKIKKQEPLVKNEIKEKIQTGGASFWARLRVFIEDKFGWVFR